MGSLKRHPGGPTVATFDEVGVKGVDVDLWYTFFLPAKAPSAVVSRLNTEISAILKLPEIA